MEIPFEIWLNISRFIPPDELQDLYGVNHAFFVIAMNERYKVIHFECRQEMLRNVETLGNKSPAAQCVRTLRLWPQIVPTLATGEWYLPRRTRYKNAIARFVKRKPSLASQATSNMIQVIAGMKNLTEFVLIRCQHCCDLPDLVAFLPVVQTGWATFGHSLRRLVLDLTLEGCEYVLSPSPIFPHLKQLSFAISKAYRTTDCTTRMSNILVPFINSHHSTLDSLELSSYDYLDLCRMLGDLRQLPLLRKLKLDLFFASLEQTNTAGLQHILELHAGSLRELNMNFRLMKYTTFTEPPPPTKWFQQQFLHVQLPVLQSLEFGMKDFLVDVDQTANYLRQYQNSLTSLVLKSQTFTIPQLDTIVSLFAEADILRKLDIAVIDFCPALLDLLSTKLPSLHDLEIEFDRFSSELELVDPHFVPQSPDLLFCQAMRRRNYRCWKLRHLDAIPSDYLGDMAEHLAAIAGAIPSLETLIIGFKAIVDGRF